MRVSLVLLVLGGVNRTLPLLPMSDAESARLRWVAGKRRLSRDYYRRS
jgi:hypothetical protein